MKKMYQRKSQTTNAALFDMINFGFDEKKNAGIISGDCFEEIRENFSVKNESQRTKDYCQQFENYFTSSAEWKLLQVGKIFANQNKQ